jgi:hypothetical protein
MGHAAILRRDTAKDCLGLALMRSVARRTDESLDGKPPPLEGLDVSRETMEATPDDRRDPWRIFGTGICAPGQSRAVWTK